MRYLIRNKFLKIKEGIKISNSYRTYMQTIYLNTVTHIYCRCTLTLNKKSIYL